MWNISPDAELDLSFKVMEPCEVLYEFDGALIFTFRSAGRLFFAYVSEENLEESLVRYLVVATDQVEIGNLKFGKVSVYQVLDKSYVWVVDRNFKDELVSRTCLANGLSDVPDDYKPQKDALLYAHLGDSVKFDSLLDKTHIAMAQFGKKSYPDLVVHIGSSSGVYMAALRPAVGEAISRAVDADIHVRRIGAKMLGREMLSSMVIYQDNKKNSLQEYRAVRERTIEGFSLGYRRKEKSQVT